MSKLRNPAAAAILAAALAGTTGYCALSTGPNAPPITPPPLPAPVSLLPEAIIPYPLEDYVPPHETD